MKKNLRRRLAILPALACSTLALAEPLALDGAMMERVTAGSQSTLERIAALLSALPANAEGIRLAELLPALGADQLAYFTKLGAEPVVFQGTTTSESASLHQPAPGEPLVLVRQAVKGDAANANALNAGDAMKTYFLHPGESLRLQQTGSAGSNSLYVYSTGNSTVTVFQSSGR